MDENLIIDQVVSILRRPSDRETERWRYTTYLLEGVCSWRTGAQLDASPGSQIPLFGGPPDEHYARPDDESARGDNPVPISDMGCSTCMYIYNTVTDHMLVYDDRKGKHLIAEARGGDRDADAVLSIIAEKHIRGECPLPKHLVDYVAEFSGAASSRRAIQ